MAGRYMKVKKVIIPVLTMVVMASSMMGCAAASKEEVHEMMDSSEGIEIEVAEPEVKADGEEKSLEWVELASLTTNPTLRDAWDKALGIQKTENGKSGCLYTAYNIPNLYEETYHPKEYDPADYMEEEEEIIPDGVEMTPEEFDKLIEESQMKKIEKECHEENNNTFFQRKNFTSINDVTFSAMERGKQLFFITSGFLPHSFVTNERGKSKLPFYIRVKNMKHIFPM